MVDTTRAQSTCHIAKAAQNRPTIQALLKAGLDRGFALLALGVLAPLLFLVALAIRCETRGTVFFRQPRGGQNGQVFQIYKFRSMTVDASAQQATRNDPRVTRVGAFLRKTSVDELPQLINILRGEMSFVGPRPHAVVHDAKYAGQLQDYMKRYLVKPGLTGWAQINRARGETETLGKMARRVRLDNEYIRNWNFWLDLRILLLTPLALITSDEAY